MSRFHGIAAQRLLAALALSLLPATTGVRVQEVSELASEAGFSAWAFQSGGNNICGGTEIWNEVTGREDPTDSALNIRWGYLESVKSSYMTGQTALKEHLEAELQRLLADLEAALAEESLPYTKSSEHHQLMEGGLGEGSFRDVAAAAEWKCGKIRKRGKARAPRKAYERSLELFRAAVGTFFSKKEFRLSSLEFLRDCHEALAGEDQDDETYCRQLCQEWTDMAKSASMSAVGETAQRSNKLKDEIEKNRRQLEDVQSGIAQCDVDWSGIEIFKGQMEALKAKHDERFQILKKAEQALADLEWEMEEVSDDLEEEEEKLKAQSEKLAELGKAVEEGQKAVDEAIEAEKKLKEKLKILGEQLTSVKSDLEQADTANSMVERLKDLVTSTMMLMSQLAEAGLREPIYGLGFQQDPKALEALFPDPVTTEGATVLKDAIQNMHSYCSKTALPAFREVLLEVPSLDLQPLCGFKDVETIFEDLSHHTSRRVEKMKKDLLGVVSWLNPWKANKKLSMEAAQRLEEELVAAGQLGYLEQVKAVYSYKGNAFFKYLLGWRKNGPHHVLIKQLQEAIEALKAKKEAFEKELAETEEQLGEAEEARKKAIKILEELEKEKELSELDREALVETIRELKSRGAQLELDLEAWRERVRLARLELEKARQALVEGFEEGVGRMALLEGAWEPEDEEVEPQPVSSGM